VIGGALRWALLTAVLGVVVAVTLGVIALGWEEDEDAESAPDSVQGSYAFHSTTLLPSVKTLTGRVGQPLDVQVSGGRLAIGADSHVFWSLQVTWPFDPSRSGRISCEGSFDRTTNAITPSTQFGFSGFPPVMDRREVQNIMYGLFCAGSEGPDTGPVEIAVDAAGLHLQGRTGATTWRRE
jgi:hypothetical protein